MNVNSIPNAVSNEESLGAIEMESIIKKYNIDGIWHFTDRANLHSIEKHGGLFSRKLLDDKCIEIPVPGGNEWSEEADKINGVDKYVHLCFLNNHPMQFLAVQEQRIKDPIWLKIAVSVMLDPKTRYTSEVSNKTGAKILNHKEAVKKIDFEVLFTYMDWKNPAIHKRRCEAEKSEILIPNILPIDKILGFKNG